MELNVATLALIAIIATLGITVGVLAYVEAAKSIVGQCASLLKNSSAAFCHNLG